MAHPIQSSNTLFLPCLLQTIYRPTKPRLRIQNLRLQPDLCEVERMFEDFSRHPRHLFRPPSSDSNPTNNQGKLKWDGLTLPKAMSFAARIVTDVEDPPAARASGGASISSRENDSRETSGLANTLSMVYKKMQNSLVSKPRLPGGVAGGWGNGASRTNRKIRGGHLARP